MNVAYRSNEHNNPSIFIKAGNLKDCGDTICLAVPGKVIEINGDSGIIDYDGVRIEVRLDLVDVSIGDYVIVHTGFAIEVLTKEDAEESIRLWKEIGAFADEPE
jgi:hydrogenase expression/formation protein HypC